MARNETASALAGKPVARAGGVNLASGDFVPFHNHVDLANPEGKGLPFAFARTYHSANVSEAGPLGPGWSHSYNIRVEATGTEAIVKWGDGRDDWYVIEGATYKPDQEKNPGVYNKLEKTPGSYLLTTPDRTVYTFEETVVEMPSGNVSIGRLVRIRNKNDVVLDILHDPAKQGAIEKVTDGAGRTYTFQYDGSFGSLSPSNRYRLIRIVESNAGNLTRTISFTYDSQGRMISSTDPQRHTTTYSYENTIIPDLLTRITLPEGNVVTAQYTGQKVDQITIGSDPASLKTVQVLYDQPLSVGGLNGTVYTEKSANTPERRIEAAHDSSSDAKVMQLIDGLGRVGEIVEWDANNNPTHVLDKNGQPWWFDYDQRTGNLIKAQNPYLQTVNLVYDPDEARANNLLSVTDAEGNATLFEYDAAGINLSKIIQVAGGSPTTTITRYPNGQVHTITGPANNTAGTPDTTTYTYDDYGYLRTVTDALGQVSQYTYDAGGRLLATEDADQVTATFGYNLLNRVTSATDMLNRTTTYAYDGNGNLVRTIDPRKVVTDTTYTDQDLVETVTRGGVRIAKYGYAAGKRSVTNAAGHTWEVTYDLDDNLRTGQTPLGHTEQFNDYDGNGNLKLRTDRTGRQISYSYDNAGRMVAKSIASGHLYGYTPDANGKLRAISRNNSPIGGFDYDHAGRLIASTDPHGQTVGYSYYPGGNLKEIVYPGNKRVSYDYDANNRLVSVRDWLNRATTYEYTAAGRLRKILYPNGASVNYLYDSAFRLQTVSNRRADNSVIAEFTVDEFDGLDAPLQMTTSGGIEAPVAVMDETTTTDAENRIRTSGGDTFTYNDQGEVLTRTGTSGNTVYTWNPADEPGQLQSVAINGSVKSYEYDGLGNRVARTAGGITTRYVLDLSGKMANVLVETDQANAARAYYVHGLGLVARILPDGTAQYYHFDRMGNVVALTNGSGTVTDQYSYAADPFGFGIARQGSTANPFTFVGRFGVMDDGDNQFYMRARYYDAKLGRFLNEDPIGFKGGDMNLYAYVGGNPMMGIDPMGLEWWDDLRNDATRALEKTAEVLTEVGTKVITKIIDYSNQISIFLEKKDTPVGETLSSASKVATTVIIISETGDIFAEMKIGESGLKLYELCHGEGASDEFMQSELCKSPEATNPWVSIYPTAMEGADVSIILSTKLWGK